MFSKNILSEELKNAIKMLRYYKKEFNNKYSWGYSIKKIGKNKYLYKMKRIDGKVIYKYSGKANADVIKKIKQEKIEKKKIKKAIIELKNEIKFIKKSIEYGKRK